MLTNKLISKNIDLSKNMFIAYSGGPDSTALLHLLSTVDLNEKAKVQAIHINHNLSKYSDSWERHCIEQCSKLNINLIGLDKLKFNPALASGPFITTSNDLMALAIYFIVALFMGGI